MEDNAQRQVQTMRDQLYRWTVYTVGGYVYTQLSLKWFWILTLCLSTELQSKVMNTREWFWILTLCLSTELQSKVMNTREGL